MPEYVVTGGKNERQLSSYYRTEAFFFQTGERPFERRRADGDVPCGHAFARRETQRYIGLQSTQPKCRRFSTVLNGHPRPPGSSRPEHLCAERKRSCRDRTCSRKAVPDLSGLMKSSVSFQKNCARNGHRIPAGRRKKGK